MPDLKLKKKPSSKSPEVEMIYKPISYFEFEENPWEFPHNNYAQKLRINKAKKQLLEQVKVELARANDQEIKVDDKEAVIKMKEALIIKHINDFFISFIKIAYAKEGLIIAPQDDKGGYDYRKRKQQSDPRRDQAYEYFKKYMLGQLLNFPADEESVINPPGVSVSPMGVLRRIKTFLEQYK